MLDFSNELWCNDGAARGCGETVDALALGASGVTHESSILSIRTCIMIIFALLLLTITLTYAIGAKSAAPWVPMRANDLERILKILKQFPEVKKIVELGAGDGRLLALTAQAGYQSEGYEISLLPYIISQFKKITRKLNYKIHYRSFWSVDVSSANAVYFFLMPQVLEKTKTKLLSELKPGSLIISYTWGLPGLTPIVVDELAGRPKILVYKVGYAGK